MKSYHDIVGDGGSDVLGQVIELQRRVETALSGVRHRVAIGSGKGGVGKSTLTHQLASALGSRGSRVAILDADLNGPTQARLAGLAGVPPIPGSRGLRLPRTPQGLGVVSLGMAVPESEAIEFDSVAQGDSQVWRATREFALLTELLAGVEWGELDYLFFDLAPGAERTFQYAEFLGPRTAFVLVTLPSAVARGVVARSAAALQGVPNPLIGYVNNMAGYHCPGCEETHPLFPDADGPEIGAPCIGNVPFDPELAARCDRGEPLGPAGGVATEAVAEIATTIETRMNQFDRSESPEKVR